MGSFIKTLTIIPALMIFAVSAVLAIFVLRSGLLNAVAWLVGLGALVIAGINHLSYGASSNG